MRKHYHSLQYIILLITLIFTVTIGGILSGITAYFYNYYIKESIVKSTDANLSFMVDSINQNITELTRLVNFCQTHTYIGDFLNYNYFSPSSVALKAHDRLAEEYRSCSVNSYIHRIIIGNDNNRFIQIVDPSYSTSQNVAVITRELDAYKVQLQENTYDFSQGFIKDPYVNRTSKNVLLVIRPISFTYSFVRGGYACFSLTEDFFTSPMQYYSLPEDSTLYLTLGEHTYKMEVHSLTEIDREYISYNRLYNSDFTSGTLAHSFSNKLTGQEGITITKPLSVDGCYITQVISSSELESHKPFYIVIIVVVTFFIVLIGVLLSAIMYRIINIPVARIQKRLERISAGDFERDTSIEWKHELGDIGRGINDLSMNMDVLLEERIQDEKAKKDLEYKMLQSQINPHFLYNTLNSIKWMAVTQGADGISEMTTALSRLMRSISKGTKLLITIKDELELVNDYFTIQQYRYGASLTMNITVDDEELYQCLIIKFTLQPLVENAIFHGIEPKRAAGTIDIHVYKDSHNCLGISVRDNGVGMSPEKIADIFTEHPSDKSQLFKEIGIANIQKRIQYEFGKEYGITVESKEGEYTEMIIHIPDRR